MKWGHYYEAFPSDQLLFWVLQCVFRPYNVPLDRWLEKILSHTGGMGGDPGWSMEHVISLDGKNEYLVWADPDISGIEPAEAIYNAEIVHQALRKSLIAFGEAYPERSKEVRDVIDRYRL
jgi:hypothetical protein